MMVCSRYGTSHLVSGSDTIYNRPNSLLIDIIYFHNEKRKNKFIGDDEVGL